MNLDKKFRHRIGNLLIIFGVIVLLSAIATLFILDSYFDYETSTELAISAAVGFIVLLALVGVAERMLAEPVENIAKAISHVSDHDVRAAKPKKPGFIGGKYIKQLDEKIYQLSTLENDTTNKIEQRKAYLEYVLESTPVAVFVFDKELNLKFANHKAQTFMDIEYKDALKQNIDKVLPITFHSDDTLRKWVDFCKDNKIKESSYWERIDLIRTDATKNIFDGVASYSKDDSAGAEVVLALVDKTETYLADESEMDFVAVAAHELRGPITIIRGYLDVFEDELKEVFTVEQRGLLEKTSVSAEQLSDTVNNILNIARIDQEHMQLHIREANWLDVISEAYENLKLRAQVHGRVLKLQVPDKLPTIAVDRGSILEVVSNLVDNAIKYSPEGGEITISVEEQENFISTTVEDHGIGIPKSVIGNLFKKFYRSHRSRQAVTGTGLGLYISKVIVDSHGGNIWVRSTEGKGSTFGFELPTYESVAEALKKGENDGSIIKRHSHGWIKNHSMYRR